ncbi:hypothetical protein K7103_001771 [Vibrio parahaemolyticus]|nr:hypothetical protein [Vibrio parahaemolyticus]
MDVTNLRKSALALSLLTTLAAPMPLLASQQEVLDLQVANATHHEEEVKFTLTKINQVKDALWAFYSLNYGWVTNLTELTTGTDPFYAGTFNTPLGNLNGVSNSGNFILTLSAPSNVMMAELQLRRIAAQTGGTYNKASSSVVIPVRPPQSASLVSNMLSRTADPSGGDLNKMMVDLEMGEVGVSSFQITDVKELFGIDLDATDKVQSALLDVGSASVDSVITDEATLNYLEAGHVNVDTGTATNFSIAGKLKSTQGEGETATFNSLNADIEANNASINKLNVSDKLFGTELNYRVGLVTANLETPELIVEEAHVPDLQANNVASRNGSAITIADSVLLKGAVSANDFTVNGNINQSPNLTAVFNKNLTTDNLTLLSASTLNQLEATNRLDVAGDTTFGSTLRIGGTTTIGGALNSDSFTINGQFKSKDLNAGGNVTVNGGIYVNNKLVTRDGTALYENGQLINSKYLTRGSKAVNTSRLDGKSLASFAQLDTANTFTQTQTFNNFTLSNASLRVGGKLIADSNGKLYERGSALSSLYETKTSLASAQQSRRSNLDSLKNEMLNKVAGVTSGISSSTVSQLESLHSQNVSRANSINSNSRNLASLTDTTKTNALNQRNSVTSLVSSVNAQYDKKRTYTVNKVTNRSTSSSETEYVGAQCPADEFTPANDYVALEGSCFQNGGYGRPKYHDAVFKITYKYNSNLGRCTSSRSLYSYTWEQCVGVSMNKPD